ncbi:MAG: alpha/beta hydrolase [Robiginitomaculum sp.]|nr:MAG: alpha/beta hydrolase [Robiginitomaculum sp.]
MTDPYEDVYYQSEDGLRLYARDSGSVSSAQTLLCMHGLTRNAADFAKIAERYRDKYRVVSVDQRGRGRSAYDPNSQNYQPDVYCRDMFRLIDHLELGNIVAIGTSMGGLMAMIMAATQPDVFKGVVLNDIGPVVDPVGIARIQSYVGKVGPFANWAEAEASIKGQGQDVFPDYTDADWADFARRVCEERSDGRVHFAYDKAISAGAKSDAPSIVPPDLWPAFKFLVGTPMLVVRGATSDILARKTVEEMQACHPNLKAVDIPRVGHAPMLDEPVAVTALDDFLEGLL